MGISAGGKIGLQRRKDLDSAIQLTVKVRLARLRISKPQVAGKESVRHCFRSV
jgi:hypothetical protein